MSLGSPLSPMFSAFANSWRIPELRARLIATVALIFVARIGANIPLPGIDPKDIMDYYTSMADQSAGGVVAMYNMFTGGALLKGAIFSLGIMPYISASIIMQLMSAVVPTIARLQQEGEVGRQKVAQYSRYLTILIAVVQSALLLGAFCNPQQVGQALGLGNFEGTIVVMESKTLFVCLGVGLLTSGAIVMLWLGEQITQRGIGNGTSVLITIGILSDLPGALTSFVDMTFGGKIGAAAANSNGWEKAAGMVLLFVIVTAGMVAINQAVRKIPIQYAQRMVGRKMYGAQTNYLPLKVNYAGVMPVIFAGAIMSFPPMLLNPLATYFPTLSFLSELADFFNRSNAFYYPRRPARRAHRPVPGLRDDAAHAGGIDLPAHHRADAGSLHLPVQLPDASCVVPRRHGWLDHGRRDARHDAPSGDLSPAAKLRRLPEEGSHWWHSGARLWPSHRCRSFCARFSREGLPVPVRPRRCRLGAESLGCVRSLSFSRDD